MDFRDKVKFCCVTTFGCLCIPARFAITLVGILNIFLNIGHFMLYSFFTMFNEKRSQINLENGEKFICYNDTESDSDISR